MLRSCVQHLLPTSAKIESLCQNLATVCTETNKDKVIQFTHLHTCSGSCVVLLRQKQQQTPKRGAMEGGPVANRSVANKCSPGSHRTNPRVTEPHHGKHTRGSKTFRLTRRLVTCAAAFALAGCAQSPSSGFSFAARTGQYEPADTSNGRSYAKFADGAVVLVAPPGYCIDQTMLRQDDNGGFALLPRCNLMHGSSWFGRNRAAVITATIGKAAGNGAPRTADIARTAQGAKLVYYDDKGVLPLARLHWPGHSTAGGAGASPEHWRGAFVLNDHLVLLALYAPEGSDLLGRSGADLLTEMTLRSLNATTATVGTAAQPTKSAGTQEIAGRQEGEDASSALAAPANAVSRYRPVARPTAQNLSRDQVGNTKSQPNGKKLSLQERIAGFFQ